jgi:molybdate/tungstate transport system substrate-binding protein
MPTPQTARRPRWGRSGAIGALAAAALVGGAWYSGGMKSGASSTSPVDVLYAGSLTKVMEDGIGPAFGRATGSTFNGYSGGSQALATDIKNRLERADVFISASPAVDKSLEGRANGNWVSSYRVLGTSILELGYNPRSSFAGRLKSEPWWKVASEPGFRLGRTDPATDPKGVLARKVLLAAASQHHSATLEHDASSTADVFPEESLVGRLQSGQLDAGFFYAVEAVAGGFPAVPLSGYHYAATYTVAVVRDAPHPAAAARFVAFLQGRTGAAILRADGVGAG